MKVTETGLPGVLLVEPDRHGDARGFFQETWHAERYDDAVIQGPFLQDNISFSAHGVLRGLHFQYPRPQGKLVYVLRGEVFDVAVDIRPGSPDFGKWAGATLSAENGRQLYVPAGFAHGFCVTGENALFVYKCTDRFDIETEGAVRWDDPRIGIDWPLAEPAVSDRDAQAPLLFNIAPERLPPWTGAE